jgi:ribokinase
VVGHVEWVTFARVAHIPLAGEIVHATDPFEEPAGGGAVAAVQLARLAGESMLMTALGEDEHGRQAVTRLGELGVEAHAARRTDSPTRTAATLLDDAGERTITTFGSRLEAVGGDIELPWSALGEMDGIYFTAGDLDALHAARTARVLVVSPRALDALGHGVPIDALVSSADDEIERSEVDRARNEAELVVFTEGERGGTYVNRNGTSGSWTAATPPAGRVDSYGCGDSFAAGLTYGLASGFTVPDALDLAARCGAVCITGHGPYQRQLTATDVEAR